MIYHYSHAPIRKEIESAGFIGLEGCRLEYFIEAALFDMMVNNPDVMGFTGANEGTHKIVSFPL